MRRFYNKKVASRRAPSDARLVESTYGIPAESIAALCGVDLATARRWKRGVSRVPVAARKLLARDLGCFDPAWEGWTLIEGRITSPEGWSYAPGEVLALVLLRQQVAALQARLQRGDASEARPDTTARVRVA